MAQLIQIRKRCLICGSAFYTDDPNENQCRFCRSTLNEFADEQELWSRELEIKGASYTDWFVIVGQLQLALRHPENIGPAANLARVFAKQIAERIVQGIPSFNNDRIKKLKWDAELKVPLRKETGGDGKWKH